MSPAKEGLGDYPPAGELVKPRYQYSEDLFAETRMSFGEHLEDLRTHLLRAMYGFIAGAALGLALGKFTLALIQQPMEEALWSYQIEYYKKHPELISPLISRVRDELAAEEAARKEEPSIEPSLLSALNRRRPVAMEIAPAELDRMVRKLYPSLFKEGGPLSAARPPGEDAALLKGSVRIRPLDFIDQVGPAFGLLGKRSRLTSLSAQETFMIYILTGLLSGLVFASPWVLYQCWSFVAAGLYPHEKRYVTHYIPLVTILLVGGIVMCHVFVMPRVIKWLFEFNLWLDIEPEPRLKEYFWLAILFPLIFGISFQLPIVMLFLEKIGIFGPDDYAGKRRIAIFLLAIFAAVITPSGDPIGMTSLLVPMAILYELGIWLARRSHKKREQELQDYDEVYSPETTA